MGNSWLRRLTWIGIGLAGLPMAALSILYIVGLMVLPALFVLGTLRDPRTERHPIEFAAGLLLGGLALVLGMAAIVAAFVGSGDDAAGLAMFVSGIAAIAAAYKMGKTVARLWPSRPQGAS